MKADEGNNVWRTIVNLVVCPVRSILQLSEAAENKSSGQSAVSCLRVVCLEMLSLSSIPKVSPNPLPAYFRVLGDTVLTVLAPYKA